MIELSHNDAQTHEMKDFEYLFHLRKSEQLPLILELKKYHDCPTIVIKSILFKLCVFYIEPVVFD